MSRRTSRKKICEHEECNTIAGFGYPGEGKKFCAKHKQAGMTNGKKKCIDCEESEAAYSDPNEYGLKYCYKCAKKRDIIIRNSTQCISDGCTRQRLYNFPGLPKKYCTDHKEKGMISVRSDICQFKGCETTGSYMLPEDRGKKYCKKHSTSEMVVADNRRCEFSGCDKKRPEYGTEPGKGTHCKEHGLSLGLKRVAGEFCSTKNCEKTPTFGLEGKKEKYCLEHKTDEMEDIVHRKCGALMEDGKECKKRPTFGDPENNIAVSCKKHMKPNYCDVSNNLCIEKDCKTRAGYGKLFKTPEHCKNHRDKNDYKGEFLNPVCCRCDEKATHGIDNYPTHCEKHARNKYKNIIEKKCSDCGLMYMLNDKNNLCENCDFSKKPKIDRKEHAIVEYLKSKNYYKITHTDNIISNLCSKKRPDCVIDFGRFMCIIEIDENQHKQYPKQCENIRMHTIWGDLGVESLLFVRFNPDNYELPEGEKKITLEKRKRELNKILKKVEKNFKPTANICVMYMFYDNYKIGKNKIYKLTYESGEFTSEKIQKIE